MTTTLHRTTVVGIFHDRTQAEKALGELRRAGFQETEIGLIARHEPPTGAAVTNATETQWEAGAATGAVAGGVTGSLLGIAVAANLIPGIGQVIAGGVLAGVLASAATGVAAGGLLGALIGLGIPEDDARFYEGELNSGRILVTVNAEHRYAEALAILQECGAYDIERTDAMGDDPAVPPSLTV